MDKKSKGYSLIEAVMVMAIMMFIVIGSLTMFSKAKESINESKKINSQQQVNNIEKPIKNSPIHVETVKITPPAPIIEKVTENHYHFEALITVIKYVGLTLLGLLVIFGFGKLIVITKNYIIVKSAVRKSNEIIMNFDKNFDDSKNFLPFIRVMSDQIIINTVLIDNRKNKDSVVHLILGTQNLRNRLSLAENNLVGNLTVKS